jgi:hypothetical protein
MDTPKIQLFPERGKTGVWKWEILLEDKMVSNGLYSGSSEHAYTAAHEALLKYQRNEMTRQNSWVNFSFRAQLPSAKEHVWSQSLS